MLKSVIKNLTCISLLIGTFVLPAYSQLINQEDLKTHLRWSIKGDKSQVEVTFDKDIVTIMSLDQEYFNKLVEHLTRLDRNITYIKNIEFDASGMPATAAKAIIHLRDSSVDIFTFYQQATNETVIDFWSKDEPKKLVSSQKSEPKVANTNSISKKKVTIAKKKPSSISKLSKLPKSMAGDEYLKDKTRDFRYGATRIWDYVPYIPELPKDIDLSIKAPDYLYTIKDREDLADTKNAHMQLSINFYKKQQWGLMARSIDLYEQKYKDDGNKEINDLMKAVSLFKNAIRVKVKPENTKVNSETGEIEPTGSKEGTYYSALNLLVNISERTDQYDLKQACLRYLIQDSLDNKDYVKSLQLAKKLYVQATEAFDDTVIIQTTKIILHSLARLGEVDKIDEFLKNKSVIRLLPKVEGVSYLLYVHLKKNNLKDALSIVRNNEDIVNKVTDPSITFNAAELYFRKGDYEKALVLFDKFDTNFTFYKPGSSSRLRMALLFDLLDKDRAQTEELYKSAINRSSQVKVGYEAKLRYVGYKLLRNYNQNKKNASELLAFLTKSKEEEKNMDQNLWLTLWGVRLRSFLVMGKYEDALTYLSTLPLDSMGHVDKNQFEQDGAEAVLGVMEINYKEANYAKVVKTWEIYREKFKHKVDNNPYTNFLAAKSYLNLGLPKSFERAMKSFDNLEKSKYVRTFPNWVVSEQSIDPKDYTLELDLMANVQSRDWEKLKTILAEIPKESKDKINYEYYQGLVNYETANFNAAVVNFEKIITKGVEKSRLSQKEYHQMLTNYIEALFKTEKEAKFIKVSAALLNDLKGETEEPYLKFKERISYLIIESMFSEDKRNYSKIIAMAENFKKTFEKGPFKYRVSYIQAISYAKLKNDSDAKSVFEKLISDNETPSLIKELARSELTTLKIRGKQI